MACSPKQGVVHAGLPPSYHSLFCDEPRPRVRAVFAPEDIPDFLREATHSARWLVWSGADLAYDTACVIDTFD